MRQLNTYDEDDKLYTSDFVKLERDLNIRYEKFRIPQIDFLDEHYHLNEIWERILKHYYLFQ